MGRRKSEVLTAQQQRYVEGRARGLSPTESALQAGYKRSYSEKAATRIERFPAVAQALAAIQAEARERAVYSLETAMKECEEVITFAKSTRNSMAFCKAVELRAKLSGLLIERIHIERVDIREALAEAEQRIFDVTPPPPRLSGPDTSADDESRDKIDKGGEWVPPTPKKRRDA